MKQARVPLTLSLLALAACTTTTVPQGRLLPAEFRHGRVIVQPALPSGETIEFYTDTGGGWNAVQAGAAERLALEPGAPIMEGEQTIRTVKFPEFAPDRWIPAPNPAYALDGRLAIAPEGMLHEEGFLGGRWFADRVWAFDYAKGTLHLLDQAQAWPGSNRTPLGFQVGEDGKRTLHFPRVAVEVDGETLQMLLDTGAMLTLTADAAREFGLQEGALVAGSFITQKVFERWAAKHPDWPVIQSGDLIRGKSAPMIRVPEIRIAGIAAGPVWFALRPNPAFEQWMSSMMDAPIVGAIGGSGLKHYRMVIDYPNAVAHFSAN